MAKVICPNCGAPATELYACASCGTTICLNCVRTANGEGECGMCADITYDRIYHRQPGDEE